MSYRAVSPGGDATDAKAVEGPGGQSLTHALRRRAAVRNLPLVDWWPNKSLTLISDEQNRKQNAHGFNARPSYDCVGIQWLLFPLKMYVVPA